MNMPRGFQDMLSLKYAIMQQEADANTERAKANTLATQGQFGFDVARTKEIPLEGQSQRQLRDAQGNLLGAQTNATNVDASLAPSLARSMIGLQGAQAFNQYATGRNTNFQTDSGVADFNDSTFANGALSALGLPTLRNPGRRPTISAPQIGSARGAAPFQLPAFNLSSADEFKKNQFGVRTRSSSIGGQGKTVEIR